MKKLTEENIKFIDRYLDNSDVVYADIRTEMVDHVASEIEEQIRQGDIRDFYYIFKDYMIEHKAKLLENNKVFLKLADRKIVKALVKESLSSLGLITFSISFIGLYAVFYLYNFNTFKSIALTIPFLFFIVLALAYWAALKRFKLERFSAIERIAMPFNIIFHVFILISNQWRAVLDASNAVYLIIVMAVFLVAMVSLFNVTFRMAKEYQRKFKPLRTQ